MKRVLVFAVLMGVFGVFGCKTKEVYVKSDQTTMKESGESLNKAKKKESLILDVGLHRLPNGHWSVTACFF